MKKKILSATLISGLLLLSLTWGASSQAREEKPKSARQKRIEEQRRAREEAERKAKRAQMEKQIKEQLRQLEEWIIYLVPTGAKPAKMAITKDILTFTDVSVTSEYLTEKDFRTSNYSLSANDDGMGVWETMQRNDKGDIAFWKGEIRDTGMRGVLGLQPKKGKMQEFTFTTEKPAGYVELAPKKQNAQAKKGRAATPDQGKVAPKTKD